MKSCTYMCTDVPMRPCSKYRLDHGFEMNIRAGGEDIYREKHGLTYLDDTILVIWPLKLLRKRFGLFYTLIQSLFKSVISVLDISMV